MTSDSQQSHAAAWIRARGADLVVAEAAFTPPGPDQIVVRNGAVAINPLEWIIQVAGGLTYRWLRYPTVLGSDLAGEVVAVGSDVTRFHVGDRVLAHAVGTDKDANNPAEGAFQQYTVVLERLAAPIPASMAFSDAAVLPLGLSTAACGLFQTDQLGLSHPHANPEPKGQTVLVWGGSTSVGSNAIQLAVAAGYDVITTASRHNADYVRTLGAREVFDYQSPDVVGDIIAELRGKQFAGAIAIGTTAAPACVRIAAASTGAKIVAITSPPVSFAPLGDADRGRFSTLGTIRRLIGSNIRLMVRARRHGVRAAYVFGTSLKTNDICDVIYRDFLPAALAEGRYRAAPEPRIVGDSLDHLQAALQLQREGVSARKVVITLPTRPGGRSRHPELIRPAEPMGASRHMSAWAHRAKGRVDPVPRAREPTAANHEPFPRGSRRRRLHGRNLRTPRPGRGCCGPRQRRGPEWWPPAGRPDWPSPPLRRADRGHPRVAAHAGFPAELGSCARQLVPETQDVVRARRAAPATRPTSVSPGRCGGGRSARRSARR